MGRCKTCTACLAVAAFKNAYRGNRNIKKLKRYDTKNHCSNPTTVTEKRQLDEIQQLSSISAHGGRVLGDDISENDTSLKPDARTTQPKVNLKEDTDFDAAAFDEYSALVLRCTDLGTNSSCSDVRAEAMSMIPKMQALMHHQSKYEVDFQKPSKFAATSSCGGWMISTQVHVPSFQMTKTGMSVLLL